MLLWDGSEETERWKLAVLDTKKSSPMDSVFKARNRVLWTQFLCLENESFGLVFYAEKPSPLDLISMQRNRVRWTRFLPTFFF